MRQLNQFSHHVAKHMGMSICRDRMTPHVIASHVIASQITGVYIVYSTVCSEADQRKQQSSASLAFVRESTGNR